MSPTLQDHPAGRAGRKLYEGLMVAHNSITSRSRRITTSYSTIDSHESNPRKEFESEFGAIELPSQKGRDDLPSKQHTEEISKSSIANDLFDKNYVLSENEYEETIPDTSIQGNNRAFQKTARNTAGTCPSRNFFDLEANFLAEKFPYEMSILDGDLPYPVADYQTFQPIHGLTTIFAGSNEPQSSPQSSFKDTSSEVQRPCKVEMRTQPTHLPIKLGEMKPQTSSPYAKSPCNTEPEISPSSLQPSSTRTQFFSRVKLSRQVPTLGDLNYMYKKDDHVGLLPRKSQPSKTLPVVINTTNYANLHEGPGPDVGIQFGCLKQYSGGTEIQNLGSASRNDSDRRPTPSLGEGSTVENIVKQYGDEIFQEVDLHSQYEEYREGDDPFDLQIPSRAIMENHLQTAKEHSSQDSFSRALFQVRRKPPALKAAPILKEPPPVAPPTSPVFGYKSAQSINRQLSNPYRKAMAEKQQLAADRYNPYLALERDVSRALRRQSTGGSEITLAELMRSDRAVCNLQHSQESSGISTGLQSKTRDGAQSKLGFHPPCPAIPSIWGNTDGIRIGILDRHVHEHHVATHNDGNEGDDENEIGDAAAEEDGWMTVSGVPTREPSSANVQGMCYRKTGSSLADNSSRGDISPTPVDEEHFLSTDKIVMHPPNMDGVYDFRPRKNSFGTAPLLMPSYKDRNTNGFFQNSSRFPPIPYYQLMPLPETHVNPFSSAPLSNFQPPWFREDKVDSTPTRRSKNEDKGKGIDREYHLGYGVGLAVSKYSFSDPDQIDLPATPKVAYRRPRVDSFDDEDSGEYVSVRESTGAEKLVRRDKTPLIRQPLSFQMTNLKRNVSLTTLPLPSKESSKKRISAKTLLQSVRYRPSHRERVYKRFKRHPQLNQDRPKCLRDGPIPETPLNADGTPPRKLSKNHEFQFRSPLAPVKRRSWQALYTNEQLAKFRERAQKNGIDDLEAQWSQSGTPENRSGTNGGGAMRTVHHAPDLFRFNYRPDENIEESEAKISAICLGICCLFPPMLLFYWLGYFDGIMAWRTRGQTLAMRENHKRIALWVAPLLTVCIIVLSVGIVVTHVVTKV